MVEIQQPKYPMELISKIIYYIENSLDSKLQNLETLIDKNKKNLSRVKKRHKKVNGIIRGYKESILGNKVSDDIKLYFALMRGNKLHLADEITDLKELRKRSKEKKSLKYRASRSPMVSILRKFNGEIGWKSWKFIYRKIFLVTIWWQIWANML